MEKGWLSVEQVAESLGPARADGAGLHPGREAQGGPDRQAVPDRPADLDTFTGRPAVTGSGPASARPRAEASTVVEFDDIDRTTADRLSTLLVAGAQLHDVVRVQTIYDEGRSRLKVIIVGDVAATADVLRTIEEGPWLTR